MCEPATMAMSALSVASSVAGINAQNSAAASNRAHAIQGMNNEIADQGRQYVEQNRSLIQGGFDSILEGREAEADAYTSAIANGVQGRSVRHMLTDKGQATSRSESRTQQELESLETQVGANFKHIQSKAQGRINSVSTTGFGLGDFAKALAPIARSQME